MKKFIVFLFAICQATSSLADYGSGQCMPFKINTNSNNKQHIKSYKADSYLQCGGNTKNNYQCKNNTKVAGEDGYIYQCTNNTWNKIEDDKIATCDSDPGGYVGFDDIVPTDTTSDFIYEIKTYGSGADIYELCKYSRAKYEKYKNDTNNNGGRFLGLGVREQPNTQSSSLTSKSTIQYGKNNLTCNSTKSKNPNECTINHIVSSSDGNVYKCTTNGWVILNDADIKSCQDNIEPLEKNHRFNGSNTWSIYDKKVENPEWIYFYESVSGAGCDPAIKIHCKYSTSKYKQEETECETQGGEFLTYGKNDDKDTFYKCYTNNVSPIEITVTDNNNNPLSMVTVIYRDIERTTNSAGKVTLPMVANRKKYNITFKKDGFVDQTVREDVLYSKPTIILNGSSNSSTTFEQPNVTTDPQKNCTNTGGTGLDVNDKCICNDSEHLEEYPYPHTDGKKYSICRCKKGYHREQDADGNYPATNKCVEAYEIKQIPNTEKYRQDAENAYRNEYDNAQSWANKGTTALSTLMTGEGAMMAARAIAEKIADDDAEEKMSEYITTMKCEYGGGQSVNLGDTETLPGGNELANYYAEYKQLADKLKATKAALNLRPGIEAEVLYDRAETGLYQYQTAERQSGGFTSLSRALMNPEGADAEQWNAQRAETNRDLWVGGALATVGLAGSYIANRAINKDHVKKYKELEEKFREIKTQLEHEYPEIFTAPTPKQPIHEESVGTLDPVIPSIEPLPANEPDAIDLSNLTDQAFNRSEINLTPEGANALTTEAKYLDDQLKEHPNMNITITATGHADPDGISAKTATTLTNSYKEIFNVNSLPDKYKNKKIGKNDDLALARAEVALKFLTEQLSDDTKKRVSTIAQTRGDKDCPKETPKEKYDTCRYVGFEVQINITGAQ